MDFYDVVISESNRWGTSIFPDFKYAHVQDIVCKGGFVYAFWHNGKWDTDLDNLITRVDKQIFDKYNKIKDKNPEAKVSCKLFNNNSSNVMTDFKKYTKNMKQSNVIFNSRIIFSNETIVREDYATNQLDYFPQHGSTESFDTLINRLYEPKERDKILWFMGALLTNNMVNIQKFMFLYGGKGTGKGTVLKIIKMLFKGYYSTIDLSVLASNSDFATAQVKEVPLLIDDDCDLSNITKDINLLKLTAHEPLRMNDKYIIPYDTVFNGLLIAASNQRYKVRNIDAGITRRAIVVEPSNLKFDGPTYNRLMKGIKTELSAIAQLAIDHFNAAGIHAYADYVDVEMAQATDLMYGFVRNNFLELGDPCTLKRATDLYEAYLDDMGYDLKGAKRKIRTELQRYYLKLEDQKKIDGVNFKNVFVGLKMELIFPDKYKDHHSLHIDPKNWLNFKEQHSIIDDICADCTAQYTVNYQGKDIPKQSWDRVKTKLSDLDTSELHHLLVPLEHVIVDFDIKDADGNKSLELNIAAASEFPETYAELSKSGEGIHLHYIYDGDPLQLKALYAKDIEIKVYKGKASLRRKHSMNNGMEISHISTFLPIEEEKKVLIDEKDIHWNEKGMRTAIEKNIAKGYHANTKPSMDFIYDIFKKAEADGAIYDLNDMRNDIMLFALSSTNHKDYCLELMKKINFSTVTEEVEDTLATKRMELALSSESRILPNEELYFFDIEVFPNMWMIVVKKWMQKPVVYINPTVLEVEKILSLPLVGFNNRRYDNHIMYAGYLGYSNEEIYNTSKKIIGSSNGDNNGSKSDGKFPAAYELSYADIYEYAATKQSLKKWEIEMGIIHDEFEYPFDEPLDPSLWARCAEYCINDVNATEELFKYLKADWTARKILCEVSGCNPNAKVQTIAAQFLFGSDPRPQDKFIYTDLSKMFPGYKYGFGKSTYRGVNPSEGGFIYHEVGVYENVALLDIASMHPNSAINMDYFGPYTQAYADLVQCRVYIKHKDFDSARKMFDGKLAPYLTDEASAKELSYALKIPINIVYGMSSAGYDNKFKHPDNVDNIVAKRGALFMVDLLFAVQEQGYKVAHIKTDSIKIPNADEHIINFVMEFGKKYGYDFEHEDTYRRLALVNKSTYIAQDMNGEWHATGAQYKDPYVFKTLFSHEPIEYKDFFTNKASKDIMYLGNNFVGKNVEVYASLTGEELKANRDGKMVYIQKTKGSLFKKASDFTDINDIDMDYYENLVIEGIEAINKVGKSIVMIDDCPMKFNQYIQAY